MSEFNLLDRFPDMRPINGPPSLSTYNGIGTTLHGRRDFDEETNTYVATHFFSFFFIPLFALGAYRVADAQGGGWYFLGKVPLSGVTRKWNWLLCLLILFGAGGIGWVVYTDTAPYKAGQKLAEANRLVDQGESRKAARMYRELVEAAPSHAAEAHAKLVGLVESPPESMADAAAVFGEALELHRLNLLSVPDLYDRAAKLAGQNEERDPQGALALLDAVSPLATQRVDLLAARKRLLERLAARMPNDPAVASRLAVVYMEMGDPKRCEAVLAPHEAQLGQLEGAALLGRIYAGKGKYEQAHKLLTGYVDARLPALRGAEQAYFNALQAVQTQTIDLLQKNKSPNFDYGQYKSAADPQKKVLVSDYLDSRMKWDPTVRAARKTLEGMAEVVPAALDLGIVRLHRAQGIADPAVRRQELELAEKTLLSVRSQAGDSDKFRLNLGQVYYWLGKHAEGKKLFDDLLKSQNRSFDALTAVANLLREVGAVTEARALVEEAYKTAPDQTNKYSAANLRSVMSTDLDDKIAWLEKSNPTDADVKASLDTSRGNKALQDGKDAEAAGFYRQAIDAYAKMVDNPATLNNCALVHFALFQVTHEREQFQRGMDKLDRAVGLQPSDSILLHNAASELLLAAAEDLVGKAVDLKVLKRSAGLDLFSFLYRDQEGKEKLLAKLRTHPGYVKARGYYKKLMVLAPRRPDAYQTLAALDGYTGDLEGLQAVWQKLQTVEVDREREDQENRDFYAGRNDKKRLDEIKKSLARRTATLEAARKIKGLTFAAAAYSLGYQQMTAATMGQEVDANSVVALAEEADEAGPCSATRAGLIQALLFRAHRALAGQNGDYGELARKTDRSLGLSLLTYVLGREGPLRERALANADVKRAVKLKMMQEKAFPKHPDSVTWAMLRVSYPAEADAIAKDSLADKRQEITGMIHRVLSPLSASTALDAHWRLLMAGKEAEADAVLAEAAKRGIPMPGPGK